MSAKNSIIRVYSRTDPSVYELSHTNNINQRLAAIQKNILDARNNTGKVFARWKKFNGFSIQDIECEIFASHKVTGLFE